MPWKRLGLLWFASTTTHLLVNWDWWFSITTPGIGRARRKRWKDDGGNGWVKLGSSVEMFRFVETEPRTSISFTTWKETMKSRISEPAQLGGTRTTDSIWWKLSNIPEGIHKPFFENWDLDHWTIYNIQIFYKINVTSSLTLLFFRDTGSEWSHSLSALSPTWWRNSDKPKIILHVNTLSWTS